MINVKKVGITFLANSYLRLISLITFPITVYLYGAYGRGIIVSCISYVTFVAILSSFSIGKVLPSIIVQYQSLPGSKKEIISESIFMVIVSSVLAYFILALTYNFAPNLFGGIPMEYLMIISFNLPFQIWSTSNTLIFASIDKITIQNKIATIHVTLMMFFSLLFLVLNPAIHWYLILMVTINLSQFSFELAFIKKEGFLALPKKIKYFGLLIKKGSQIHLESLAAMTHTHFTVILINIYLTTIDVGIFNYATQIFTILVILPNVIHQYLMSEIVKTNPNDAWQDQKKTIKYALVLMALAGIFSFWFIVPFTNLFRNEFLDSVIIFRYLLIAVLFASFAKMMYSQWLARSFFKEYSSTMIVLGLITLGINFWFLPIMGLWAAVISFILMYVLNSFVHLWMYFYINKLTTVL